jgi:hypothetical protein
MSAAADVLGATAASRTDEAGPGPLSPVIVLSPPRSFSSLFSMMLGQHPQLYGLPETQLFVAETLREWWDASSRATFPMTHGLLRAVAQLIFGGQTAENVPRAVGWLSRRWYQSTGMVLETLAETVYPRRVVEKSPSIVFQVKWMQRAHRMFPDARYIHLARHPRGYTESVMRNIEDVSSKSPVPRWLLDLATEDLWSATSEPGRVDPQRSWLQLHRNILEFLSTVPPDRQRFIRGEDVLFAPERELGDVARWLGIRDDPEATEAMLHPELSPFAHLGPPGAIYGNDVAFLQNPTFRPGAITTSSLDDPLSGLADGMPVSRGVRELAEQLGYV